MLEQNTAVKIIGSNGQISLGKQFAGQQVLVEQPEEGVWLIRTAMVIPHNELWLHRPKAQQDLTDALKWAKKHPSSSSPDPQTLIKELENGENAQENKRRVSAARSK